jgi:hypothetical protein
MRRDFAPFSLVGNYGHGAAATVAQPVIAGAPWLRVADRVVLYLDHENSAVTEAVK